MPNLLKRKRSAPTPSLDDQPWATAHLTRPVYNLPPAEGATMTNRSSDKIPVETAPTPAQTMPSLDADAITPAPEPSSSITRPAPPRHKHTFSELFDLSDIAAGDTVRSPSGNVLSAEQAAKREDRPRGIKEGQETIRRRVKERRGSSFALGNRISIIGDAFGKEERAKEDSEKKGKRFGWLFCCWR